MMFEARLRLCTAFMRVGLLIAPKGARRVIVAMMNVGVAEARGAIRRLEAEETLQREADKLNEAKT